jgi:hypothetical protein
MQASRNHPINCGLTNSQFSRTFSKQTIADRSVDLELVASPNILRSQTNNNIAINGMNLQRNIGSIVRTDIRLSPQYFPGKDTSILRTETNNSQVASATFDPLFFQYESTGPVKITAEFENGEKAAGFFITSSAEGASWDDLLSFQSGTLGEHIFNQIAQRANGTTSLPGHVQVYSTYNEASQLYVKNTTCWCASLDFSGITVSKQGSGGVTTMSAITPHHAIGAAHYPPAVGDVLFFCDSNNNTISRTITARAYVPQNTIWERDSVIVRLNEALPSTVKKYKTLPPNFTNYAPYTTFTGANVSNTMLYCPMVITSHFNWSDNWPLQRRNRYAYLNVCHGIVPPTQRRPNPLVYATPFPAAQNIALQQAVPNIIDYNGWPSGIRGGDSGSPMFFVINNELVIAGVYLNPYGGPFQPSFLSAIQQTIDSLGPSGQTYETVDLSSFTNFS